MSCSAARPSAASFTTLLFALDMKLAIPNGFHYAADCDVMRRNVNQGGTAIYCGGDFGNSGVAGSTDGFGDAGGDGGGGCGGGD